MTSPDRDADTTPGTYHVHIGEGKGIVIGNNAQVTQHFYELPMEPQGDLFAAEAIYRQKVIDVYSPLNFSGFDRSDVSLANVPLEDIFVRLTLTREKVIREPVPAEPSNHVGRDAGRTHDRIITVQEPIALDQALSQPLLIIGEPGAGKSTLLRWLAITFAQKRQQEPHRVGATADSDRLPLFVELANLPDRYVKPEGGQTPNWLQFLPEYLCAQMTFTGTSPELLMQALGDGRCLLLFDGLDEIADRHMRARIARSLADLARLSPGNRIIIGSRPAGMSESEGALRPLFQRCQIERFTPKEVKRFFHFWYALDHHVSLDRQQSAADELFTKVQASPAILQLATTPLLSTILLLIWRNEGDLPKRRVDLYERCCRALIEDWENHHHVSYQGVLSLIGWERHLRLLAPLAYAIHSQEQRTHANRVELIPVLAQGLQREGLCRSESAALFEAELFLTTLGLRSGLLQYIGGDQYIFPHQTFQEYLAARYIASQPDPDFIDLVMIHLHESWWREVHLLTIGQLGSGSAQASKASELILTIMHLYRPPLWFLRSSRHQWLRLIGPGKFLPQVQLARRIAWMQTREFELAAEGYGECEPEGVTATVHMLLSARARAFVQCLISDYDRFRAQRFLLPTISALLRRHNNETIMRILLEALYDSKETMSFDIAVMLIEVGINEAVAGELLEDCHAQKKSVRAYAAIILQQAAIDNETIMSTLQKALHAQKKSVRSDAAVILAQIGINNESVVSALLEALHDPTRDAHADVLTQLGGSNRKARKALIATRKRESDVRSDAVVALGKVGIGNERVASALLETLHDRKWGIRRQAVESLGMVGIGNERVVSALLEILHDRNSKMHDDAAAIRRKVGISVGNERVVSALLKTLHDREWKIRHQVVESLGMVGIGNERVVSALLEILSDRNPEMHDDAAVILALVGVRFEAVIGELLESLHNHHWLNVSNLLHQAGRSREATRKAMIVLFAYAKARARVAESNRGLWRSNAAVALGKVGIGEEAVVSALQKALHDQNETVRRGAARGLQQIEVGNKTVVSELREVPHDNTSDVRSEIVERLPQTDISNEKIVSALLEALDNSDQNVRLDAMESLEQIEITNPIHIRRLLVALNRCLYDFNEDSHTRAEALFSIGQLLDGRSIPGYRWRRLRKRRAWYLQIKRDAYWIGVTALMEIMNLMAAQMLGILDPNGSLGRFLPILAGIIAFVAAVAYVLNRTLRDRHRITHEE